MGNIDGKDLEDINININTTNTIDVTITSLPDKEPLKESSETPNKVSSGRKSKTRSKHRPHSIIGSTSEEQKPLSQSSSDQKPLSQSSSNNSTKSSSNSSKRSSSNKSSSDQKPLSQSSSNNSTKSSSNSSKKSSSDQKPHNQSSSNSSTKSTKSSSKKSSRNSTPTRKRGTKSKKTTKKLINSKEELSQEGVEMVDNATQPEVEEKVTGTIVVEERKQVMTAEQKTESDKKDQVLFMIEKTAKSKKASELWKKMSEEQRSKILRTVFDKYDTNKDGVISLEELKVVMPNYGFDLSGETAELLIRSFSKSGEAKQLDMLNFSDFCEFSHCFFKIKMLFDQFDVDDDNNITVQQFHDLIREYSFQFDDKTVNKLFSLYDTDKSGTMSWSEFSRMMLYLQAYRKEYSIIVKERDGIDTADLHALLHSLNILVSTTEAEIIRKRHLSELDDQGSIESMVVVMLNIESELPELRKEAEAERRKTREALRIHKKIPKRTHMNKKHVPLSEEILHVKEANKIAQKIIAQLSEGELWSDPQFPSNPESLYKKDKTNLHLVAGWKRPSEITENPELFLEGVDSGDVIQGALGDCWFLSALSTLATHGYSDVKNMIMSYYPKNGIYQCQFFKNDGWHTVTCDDLLPVDKNNTLVFGSCKDSREFWVPFLEKAYAKLHGSFEAIEAGSIADGLTDLTGEGSETTVVENTPQFWNLLGHHIKEGFLLGCSQTENYKGKAIFGHTETETPLGILTGHAYGIIDCQDIQGHRLVKCRNPWGCKEWKGRWSDGSKEWTPALLKHFNYSFADDGTFFMCFDDFCSNFNKLYVLRLLMDDIGEHWYKNYHKHEWTAQTAGGCPNHATFSKNPQYLLSSSVDCPVWVYLSQNDSRGIHENPYEPIGVCLVEKLADNDFREETPNMEALQMSKYPTSRASSLDFKMVANKPYVIIPSTFNSGTVQPYYLTVYTKFPSKFEPLTKKPPMTEVKGSWSIKDKTAGGCIKQNSWIKNPQYLLEIKKKAKIPIMLEQEERNDLEYIGIFAWKSPDGLRLLNATNPIISGEFVNSVSVTEEVELDPGKYILMPCTYEPKKETNFTVRIVSTDCTLEPVLEWAHVKATGAWISKTDGGCTNNKTWKSNPCFDLHVPDECQLNILLKLPKSFKNKFAFGFYVFNKSMTAVKNQSKFCQSSPPYVLQSVTLPMGDYVLLPCTLKPKEHSNFTIYVYSDKPGVTLNPQ